MSNETKLSSALKECPICKGTGKTKRGACMCTKLTKATNEQRLYIVTEYTAFVNEIANPETATHRTAVNAGVKFINLLKQIQKQGAMKTADISSKENETATDIINRANEASRRRARRLLE